MVDGVVLDDELRDELCYALGSCVIRLAFLRLGFEPREALRCRPGRAPIVGLPRGLEILPSERALGAGIARTEHQR